MILNPDPKKQVQEVRQQKQIILFWSLTQWVPVLRSYKNQSIDLLCKSIDWFLYEGSTGTQWVNRNSIIQSDIQKHLGMFLDIKSSFYDLLKTVFDIINKTK